MVLGKLDDTLWHQLATTFDHVGTSDPRFFDRFWFAVYDPNGTAALQIAMAVYNNMNVMDGGCVMVRAGVQRNLRLSRALRPQFEPVVGPLRVEIEEPLERMRLLLAHDENADAKRHIACDLRWQAVLPPEEEQPHFERIRGRVAQDYQRFNQVGEVTGWIEFGDERVEVDRWWGGRDHSWGVRPGVGGIEEPVTGESPPFSEVGTLFYFLFFSTEALAGHVQFMERGPERVYLTGLIRERDAADRADLEVVDAALRFELFEDTRRCRTTILDITLRDGRSLALETTTIGSAICMTGLGYGGWDDAKGLGVYRGQSCSERDVWNVSHPADVVYETGEIDRPYHRIAPVRVESDFRPGDHGTGSLTFVAMGTLPQYDLEG